MALGSNPSTGKNTKPQNFQIQDESKKAVTQDTAGGVTVSCFRPATGLSFSFPCFVNDHHKLSGSQKHKFIISQLWGSSSKIEVSAGLVPTGPSCPRIPVLWVVPQAFSSFCYRRRCLQRRVRGVPRGERAQLRTSGVPGIRDGEEFQHQSHKGTEGYLGREIRSQGRMRLSRE